MTRHSLLAALAASVLAGTATGGTVSAGDGQIVTGGGAALWREVKLGGKVCSSFTSREEGKALDVSGSKAAELKAKVAALKADAPCRMARGRSRLGDETFTLENGLVKVVIVPALGGRIIELSNKATGANIFMDNYQNAKARPDLDAKRPPKKPIGGWIDGVDNHDTNSWKALHKLEVLKESQDELVVKTVGEVENSTWGVAGTVTVSRTVSLRRASARVGLAVELVNHSGETEREMRFRAHARHALGGAPAGDEFWLSSLGYACYMPAHEGDCYAVVRAEPGIDRWQAILDRPSREGVVVFPGGEINGRFNVWGNKGVELYTYENNSELREHVVEGSKIGVEHDYAPVLNFDAVSFASHEAAVCFMPGKFRVAPNEKVSAVVAAAMISGGTARKVTLKPRLLTQSGDRAGEMKAISIDAPLLVAEPKTTEIEIPRVPGGRYDLVADVVGASGGKLGTVRHKVFVSDPTGVILDILRPTDDGYGKGLSVTGELQRAATTVASSGGGGASGALKVSGVELPWSVKIAAAGELARIDVTTDFSSLPKDARIAAYGLAFPIAIGDNTSNRAVVAGHRVRWEHAKVLRTTVGGTFRDDQYMLDQHRATREQDIPYYYLSDGAARMPMWRYGGVIQTAPTNSWIWKAAGDDVVPVPLQTERSAAGWVDVHSPLAGQGVLVCMPRMAERAPKGLVIDGEAGEVKVWFFPPHVPAMGLGSAGAGGVSRARTWGLGDDGKAIFTVFVHFHADDLAGDITKAGNRASKIRAMVAGLK